MKFVLGQCFSLNLFVLLCAVLFSYYLMRTVNLILIKIVDEYSHGELLFEEGGFEKSDSNLSLVQFFSIASFQNNKLYDL